VTRTEQITRRRGLFLVTISTWFAPGRGVVTKKHVWRRREVRGARKRHAAAVRDWLASHEAQEVER
jgi:hypothetical protein